MVFTEFKSAQGNGTSKQKNERREKETYEYAKQYAKLI
jgi:hypothetical protein